MSSFNPGTAGLSQAALSGLRPLSIGEMLDRAFSICFKHLVPFLAIVSIVVLPQLVSYYLGFKDVLSTMSDAIDAAQKSAGGVAPPVDPTRILQAYANGAPYLAGFVLIALFIVPLSNAAIVSGVSRAYLGLPVRFAACYADALLRWLPLVGLTLLWFAVTLLAAVTSFIFFFLLASALAAMGALLGSTGVAIAIVIGIALGVGVLLLVFDLYLAAAYSFVGAVLEGLGPGAAFVSGFTRVFGEGQFWRSLGIAASLFGIIIGLELIGGLIGGLTQVVTHSYAIEFAVSGIVGAFTYPFLFAVVAVSYYDVRIRREGFDLQILAAQLGASPASTPTPR